MSVALVLAVVIAGCPTRAAAPVTPSELAAAQSFKQFTVYWVGRRFGGVALTATAEPSTFYSPGGFIAFYGDCGDRGPFHAGGCTLPLKITTAIYTAHSDKSYGPQRWVTLHGVPAVVYHGGRAIEIYTDHKTINVMADKPALAMAAADALEPFNRVASAGFPAFPPPTYEPNLSREELQAQRIAGGATGVTGATSDIRPPATLEPAVRPSR